MKKIIACLFAAALCLCSLSAFAQQIEPADKGRILPGLPPGMVASCTASSGRVDIVIDTDRTDWDMVATAAKKSGSLVIHPGIARPADMLDVGAKSDYYWYSGYSAEQSEARTFAELANVGFPSSDSQHASEPLVCIMFAHITPLVELIKLAMGFDPQLP